MNEQIKEPLDIAYKNLLNYEVSRNESSLDTGN
jgi:hypothetical protein